MMSRRPGAYSGHGQARTVLRLLPTTSNVWAAGMRIVFIGLGYMGSAMAANLVEAGHEVTVFNRSRGKVDALAAEGARPAASVADACRGDVVVTMLANDEAVEGFVFGEGGVLSALARGATHVSSS